MLIALYIIAVIVTVKAIAPWYGPYVNYFERKFHEENRRDNRKLVLFEQAIKADNVNWDRVKKLF